MFKNSFLLFLLFWPAPCNFRPTIPVISPTPLPPSSTSRVLAQTIAMGHSRLVKQPNGGATA